MAETSTGEAKPVSKKPVAKKKKSGSGTAVKSGILILVLVSAIIGFYYYLSNRTKQEEPQNVKRTVVQELLDRNLDNNYPPTPKEVVRYYSEITKCFYNEEYTKEELEQLAAKARELYDDELSAANDWSKYIIELQNEIDYYKNNGIRVSAYQISASTDVDEFKDDGFDFARLYCTYTLSSGSHRQAVEEVFLLRKDENGHWRIYGWDLAENVKVGNR